MKPESVIAIWLAKFDSETGLIDYTSWKYSDSADRPKCSFASDIGLSYFDSDFLESIFVATPSKLLEKIGHISFAENFKEQLMNNLHNINYTDKNSIISLSGSRDIYGTINDRLFSFKPKSNRKDYLQFIGIFKY